MCTITRQPTSQNWKNKSYTQLINISDLSCFYLLTYYYIVEVYPYWWRVIVLKRIYKGYMPNHSLAFMHFFIFCNACDYDRFVWIIMMTWIHNFAKILYPYLVWDLKSLYIPLPQLIYLFLYSHYLAYILKSVFWPNTKPYKKKGPFQYIDL